jgi:hypothetical protein
MAKPFIGSNRFVESFNSNGDLSANQYKAVRIFASMTVGTPLTNGADAIGIQENQPDSSTGAEIRVCLGGITKAVAGAAFSTGVRLVANGTSNTQTGLLYAANTLTSADVIGISLQSAAAASEVVSILLNPFGNIN